jgi:hypothetical protein
VGRWFYASVHRSGGQDALPSVFLGYCYGQGNMVSCVRYLKYRPAMSDKLIFELRQQTAKNRFGGRKFFTQQPVKTG